MIPTLITALVSYLLGSIPFGYLLVRIFRGADVRTTGSGNIGATNVARTSPALGIVTLILDALKGIASVVIARDLTMHISSARDGIMFPADLTRLYVAALFAIIGHVFPVWLNFRGGKGVATALGGFFLLAPRAMFAAMGVFLFTLALSRYVSVSSVSAAATFPLLVWAFDREHVSAGMIVSVCIASLVIIGRHHQNLRRVFAGTEPRFRIRRT